MKTIRKYILQLESAELRYAKSILYNLRTGLKWMALAVAAGLFVGAFSSVFAKGLEIVTELRESYPQFLFLLPVGGLSIVAIYQFAGLWRDKGTNVLMTAIHGTGEDVPGRVAPLIFAATLITHLFGGSAGREGAALQMGGSLGNSIGRFFRLKADDRKIMVMCGMSAAFSAVFGTPLAASIFPMEMISVGIMQYAALLPCVFAALVANQFAVNMGINPEAFTIREIPDFGVVSCGKIILLGILCAGLSVVFCLILRGAGFFYNKYFKNPYLRVFVGGLLVIAVTLLEGSGDYNGAGTEMIARAVAGSVPAYAFLLKMFLTALTLAAGYKGGEIVPAFFTGAAFGCLYGQIMGISPSLCAAVGMIALFCGVTNCPIASMLIGFELFGFAGVRYLLMAIAISYMLSGYRGLYSEQVIVYSKYHPKYINRFSGDEHFSGEDYED